MKEVLNYLFEHKTLSYAEAKEVLVNMAQAKYNESEMAAFLAVYIMRSITLDELRGFRDALLELCKPLDFKEFNTIDLCGTGGDSKNTFNISTLASFIVAGAGEKVAKHGNYGVSSVSGSSNMLEHFGYKFSNDADTLRRQLDKAGICFMHAPLFHPAMKNVGGVRKALRVKTFFNMLGPMVNPAFPPNQMVGVFNLEVARLYHYLYQQENKQFSIIHSNDGYDEISLTGSFKVLSENKVSFYNPDDLGYPKLREEELHGGNSIDQAATIFKKILEGQGTDAQVAVVTANAAMALQTMHRPFSFEKCKDMAAKSLHDGAAKRAFERLLQLSA